jgi:hypothetical protein
MKDLRNYAIAITNTLWVLCVIYYFGNCQLQDYIFLSIMYFISIFTVLIYWFEIIYKLITKINNL